MEKFIKSIFHTSERRKSCRHDEVEEDKPAPPLDIRRKLSISRSGRMRQANRKRHSLTMDLYGEEYTNGEKPKQIEYHVNNQMNAPKADSKSAEAKRRHSSDMRTPDEEIDDAFEIIDKS